VLSSLSWLSNGGLDGQFDHDLIDMAYDLTEVFDKIIVLSIIGGICGFIGAWSWFRRSMRSRLIGFLFGGDALVPMMVAKNALFLLRRLCRS